jgi:hypothetical protein
MRPPVQWLSPDQFLFPAYPPLALSLALTEECDFYNVIQAAAYIFMQIHGPSGPEISTSESSLRRNGAGLLRFLVD